MTWGEFFKNNFGILVGTAATIFYSILLWRQKKAGNTIDSLNTELALTKAQLAVEEIKAKKEKNDEKLSSLRDQQRDIIKKINSISKTKTSKKLSDQELVDFLTKELNDNKK
jgi:hypothetical protein